MSRIPINLGLWKLILWRWYKYFAMKQPIYYVSQIIFQKRFLSCASRLASLHCIELPTSLITICFILCMWPIQLNCLSLVIGFIFNSAITLSFLILFSDSLNYPEKSQFSSDYFAFLSLVFIEDSLPYTIQSLTTFWYTWGFISFGASFLSRNVFLSDFPTFAIFSFIPLSILLNFQTLLWLCGSNCSSRLVLVLDH